MTDIITKAREEWCEPWTDDPPPDYSGYYWDGVPYAACPPSVVAALLDVVREAKEPGFNADREMVCVICGAEWKQTSSYDLVAAHHPDCALVKAEAAIARALEGK